MKSFSSLLEILIKSGMARLPTSRGEDTTNQQITLHSSSSAHYDLIRSYLCFMVKPVSGQLTWYTDQEGGSLLPEEILELARKNAGALIDKSKDSKL